MSPSYHTLSNACHTSRNTAGQYYFFSYVQHKKPYFLHSKGHDKMTFCWRFVWWQFGKENIYFLPSRSDRRENTYFLPRSVTIVFVLKNSATNWCVRFVEKIGFLCLSRMKNVVLTECKKLEIPTRANCGPRFALAANFALVGISYFLSLVNK